MPKKNTLKIVPIAKRYERINPTDYSLPADQLVGYKLMEYTSGRPGEQTSYGTSRYYDHVNKVYRDSGIDHSIDWRPNEPFEATLTLRRLDRGRSAARFWFEDEDSKTFYPFFGQTLVDMLSESTMINGRVKGTWIVVKKGANYGIELHK